MTDWNTLAEAGKELAQAFHYLDRASETATITAAAIITKTGLVDAARVAVGRANRLLER
ncbi:MAG: hypothetical protein HY985_19575 [Magnetospirillum sp.]|nr:hypothetical protein [Magnetospirillum sp.]